MNRSLSLATSLAMAWLVSSHLWGNDLDAVRSNIDLYVSAFNRGDAMGIGQLWSETGEWISPGGRRIVGREAIEDYMQDYFAEGGAEIEVLEPRIRLLAPTVAMEEGTVRVTRPGEIPASATYIAIHVKHGDAWKLESVRETEIPQEPSNYEYLKELEWMIGSWVDEDENVSIETKCQWTKNRNFITRSFAIDVDGKTDLEGTQIIGYDAANAIIRSWTFDSAGGFGTSTWKRDGSAWIVNNSQTLRDGAKASSVNTIRYLDDDTCTWESTGREVDGELLPSIPAVRVTRVAAEADRPEEASGQGEAIDTDETDEEADAVTAEADSAE